eukprot:TRINITY_DN12741_c0_g1_i1.p2 TRINITY_DN12741_c0_g1~~TRINITY_DN12741_c0_g1_i1.p2  ORF type:complete len:109 (+),score=3.80 TRINITY_DN12741_c0_g1_i1:578-904(+)
MAAQENSASLSDGSRKQTWAEIVSGNRDADAGVKLEFIPQQFFSSLEVFIDEGEWQQGISKWENSLIGFVFGLKPHILKIQNYVKNRWGGEDIVTLSQLDRGMFLFKF